MPKLTERGLEVSFRGLLEAHRSESGLRLAQGAEERFTVNEPQPQPVEDRCSLVHC